MSVKMEEDIKRWAARHIKCALVLDLFLGKTKAVDAYRVRDLLLSEVERQVEHGKW